AVSVAHGERQELRALVPVALRVAVPGDDVLHVARPMRSDLDGTHGTVPQCPAPHQTHGVAALLALHDGHVSAHTHPAAALGAPPTPPAPRRGPRPRGAGGRGGPPRAAPPTERSPARHSLERSERPSQLTPDVPVVPPCAASARRAARFRGADVDEVLPGTAGA